VEVLVGWVPAGAGPSSQPLLPRLQRPVPQRLDGVAQVEVGPVPPGASPRSTASLSSAAHSSSAWLSDSITLSMSRLPGHFTSHERPRFGPG
jgi:hypothetical protein